MAHQCTSCGSQTRSGAKFCHTCGTPIATTSLPPTMPIGAPSATAERKPTSSSFESPVAPRAAAATEAIPAPTAYIPQTPQTYYTPSPPMQTPKKSGNTVKVVLITLAIIMVLSITAIIGGVYVASKKASQKLAELKRNGLPTITSDPNSVPDEKLGVPVYPGAKRTSTVDGSFGPYSGLVVEFATDDDFDKVANFYRDYYAGKEGQQIREISDNEERSMVFQVNTEKGPRMITIAPDGRNDDRTKIVVLGGRNIQVPSLPKGKMPPHPEIPPPPPPPPALPVR